MPRKSKKTPVATSDPADIFHSVVKIFTTFTEPNFGQPWSMCQQKKATGTGFLVSNKHIITNAHVVAYHTAVQVRKHGSPDKFTAKVLAIAHDSDLAIMTVENPAFWEGVTELEFGEMPTLQQPVLVVGYPIGGETISVTAGVVSRVDYDAYAHSTRENLVAQVDAAINPGNSGGPVLGEDGSVIGVAFQGLNDGDNIGYIIPVPVVRHVLKDFESNGCITGSARISFDWQTMENEHMREFCGLPAGVSGVRVTEIYPTSRAAKLLHVEDVVSAVDEYEIADDGTICLHGDVRVPFAAVCVDKFIGDSMRVVVYRKGRKLGLTLPVENLPVLVPLTLYEKRPSYYVFGGLVFTHLTLPYVEAVFADGSRSAPLKLVQMAEKEPTEEGQQVVILADILSHPVNVGYESNVMSGMILKSIDDKPIVNLVDVAVACKEASGKFIKFVFDDGDSVIMPTEVARAATAEIMKTNAISSACSEDLVDVCAPACAGKRRSKRVTTE